MAAYTSTYTGAQIDQILAKANNLPATIGTGNQLLMSNGSALSWATKYTVPAGGTTNNVLVKTSATDGECSWQAAAPKATSAASVDHTLRINEGGTGATTSSAAIQSLNIYPVGSVVCMSTNRNPSAFFGGTWELIDKEFTPRDGKLDQSLITLTGVTSLEVQYTLAGHSLLLKMKTIVLSKTIGETDQILFSIPPDVFGCQQYGVNDESSNFVTFDDGSNAVLGWDVNHAQGTFTIYDVRAGATSVAAGKTISRSHFDFLITADNMMDSACNKFYFKRTA